MPLETATYINQLDAANPLGSDPIASGDDHLRLIKSAVKATFPNITGPMTVTQGDLNSLVPGALQKSGGTMTGALVLAGDPAAALQPATKQYVDAANTTLTASVATKANSATTISAGTGLTGGGDLSANRTLALANTAVTPGTYGSSSAVPVVTVDAQGRVTNATTAAIRGLGFGGETWKNETGNRAFNTQYTNTRGYPIAVSANTVSAGPSPYVEFVVNGVRTSIFYWQFNGAGAVGGGVTIVPPGATYQLNSNAGLAYWAELY